MNKFLKGALAIAATGTVGFAEPTDSNDWLELDSEINSLATSYASAQDGMGWTALLRFTYTFSSDDIATGGGDDVSGFKFEDVDMAFWGGVGTYQWRVSWDVANGVGGFILDDLTLEDAFIMFECEEYFTTTAGNYKMRVLMSNDVDPERQLFIDRTPLGSAFDFWDAGVELTGTQDMLRWYAALQNGSNGQNSGHRYSVRAEYDFGTGASLNEAALGANDDFNGTVGATYFNDDTLSGDTSMIAIDFRGTYGLFGMGAEIAFIDEDLANNLSTSVDFSRISNTALSFANDDDTNPLSIWLSYCLNEEFEGAVRFDDLDNMADESIISVVVNWYRSSHNAKWQLQVSDVDSDNDDGTIIQIGYVVGATR